MLELELADDVKSVLAAVGLSSILNDKARGKYEIVFLPKFHNVDCDNSNQYVGVASWELDQPTYLPVNTWNDLEL